MFVRSGDLKLDQESDYPQCPLYNLARTLSNSRTSGNSKYLQSSLTPEISSTNIILLLRHCSKSTFQSHASSKRPTLIMATPGTRNERVNMGDPQLEQNHRFTAPPVLVSESSCWLNNFSPLVNLNRYNHLVTPSQTQHLI